MTNRRNWMFKGCKRFVTHFAWWILEYNKANKKYRWIPVPYKHSRFVTK